MERDELNVRIAIGFDFDHTLGVDNKLERTVGAALLVDGASKSGSALARETAERAMDDALERFRRGETSLDEALARGLAALGLLIDERAFARRFREEVVARAPEFVRPVPGALELLAALRAERIPYALLTNGWSPLQERKAELLGFDAPVLVSETMGARKPDRVAFERLAALFAPTSQIWYVGDDPMTDIVGALEAGVRGIWFDWERRAYPSALPPPSWTIHALDDVIVALRDLQGGVADAAKRDP